MDILPIPDAGPVFRIALAAHILCGLTCVATGAAAATSRKGGARHLRYGRTYVWSLGILFATMAVMSVIRWHENAHLFAIGSISLACGLTGHLSRKSRPNLHIAGMGASFIGLLTGFYVDNGPNLPLWNQLPPISFWVLPSLIGAPLIARAIATRRAGAANRDKGLP